MKIVFVSNYYNHHQSGLSYKFNELTDYNYTFIESALMPKERKLLGYRDEYTSNFILDSSEIKEAIESINGADVILIGSARVELLKSIKSSKKVLFRYSERVLKDKIGLLKYIHRFIRLRDYYFKKSENYLLCAGAYVVSDYAKFGLYKNRAYKWGYFPETIRYENIKDFIDKKKKTQLLWCGRLIDLKHPDDAIKIAKKLKAEGYEFELNIIGGGHMEDKLRALITENNLQDSVRLLGTMDTTQVRRHMESAGIYLFTSDRQEGWGAVLNEAMNSGCAVIASNEVGSVPYLVKDNYNGCIYESGNVDSLYEKVKLLLDNEEMQSQLGEAAYQTIINEWNAETAAERLINLSQHILEGEEAPDLYETGPCSKA